MNVRVVVEGVSEEILRSQDWNSLIWMVCEADAPSHGVPFIAEKAQQMREFYTLEDMVRFYQNGRCDINE